MDACNLGLGMRAKWQSGAGQHIVAKDAATWGVTWQCAMLTRGYEHWESKIAQKSSTRLVVASSDLVKPS